jgi:Ni,Fe-hydrogenase III small subunit
VIACVRAALLTDSGARSAVRSASAHCRIAGALSGLVELYDGTTSLQDRTVATGHLKPRLALQYAAGGYVGRASGRAFDARRHIAYPPYDSLQFEVPVLEAGDVNARVWIRIREVEQSLSLIEQILDRLPEGPVRSDIAPAPEAREGMAIVEGFRGDILVWLRIAADGRIERCHLRDPSWFQWPLLEAAIEGNIVADFPAVQQVVQLFLRRSRSVKVHVMRKLLFESLVRFPVTESPPSPSEAAMEELAQAVDQAARKRLGRSLSVREVDAGSCNGCELEINALNNSVYDIERFGIRFVASPRHADVLLVTGPVTRNMREALERTYKATPGPKWVVAVGDCAADGGCFAGSYAVVGGVSEVVPVDLHVPGCPPPPLDILKALLVLLILEPQIRRDVTADGDGAAQGAQGGARARRQASLNQRRERAGDRLR